MDIGHTARNTKKPVKIELTAFQTELSVKNAQQGATGALGARFGRGWGVSRASLERLGAALGTLLGAPGGLLGASSDVLGVSFAFLGATWLPQAAQTVLKLDFLPILDAPGVDFGGFWGCAGQGFGSFKRFLWHSLRSVTNVVT